MINFSDYLFRSSITPNFQRFEECVIDRGSIFKRRIRKIFRALIFPSEGGFFPYCLLFWGWIVLRLLFKGLKWIFHIIIFRKSRREGKNKYE